MKIVDIKATTVTLSLEPSLRQTNRAHWGRFVRTAVEPIADNGFADPKKETEAGK
jgi:glucarate dehydratase